MYFKNTLGIIALSSAAFLAQADEPAQPNFYIGLKTGQFMIDVEGADDATAVGFQVGYDFGNQWAIELEMLSGESDLEIFGNTIEVETETFGIYGTFRSADNVYLMGKVGIVEEEVSGSAGGFSSSESDSGLSLGIGVGTKLNNHFAAELEYTIIEQDVDYIGLNTRFLF